MFFIFKLFLLSSAPALRDFCRLLKPISDSDSTAWLKADHGSIMDPAPCKLSGP